MIRRSSIAALFALAATALPSAAPIPHTPYPTPATVSDSLRIFYIGRPAGWEHYELTQSDGGAGYTLTSDYDYVDRGRRNHTALTITTDADYGLKTFETFRVTDTSRTPLISITFSEPASSGPSSSARSAHVVRGRAATDVAIPNIAYAVSSYQPTVQNLALIRYWEAHKRPATIAVVPGDPNPVTIKLRAFDTVGRGANRVVLKRYTIDGVIWGINYAWLDNEGRLAMFATGGGGGLSFKTVRAALLPLRDELMLLAARAQMQELEAISGKTKPIAEGNIALVGATVIDMTGAGAIPNATVVVSNGRITAVGPTPHTPYPPGTRVIDATGKTIVPGLWDNHAHLHQIEWIPAYFAAGVTSVRDMGSEWPLLVAMRNEITKGSVNGPSLFFAGLVDGPGPQGFGEFSAATPEEGRAIVRRYHAMGFEMIKIYLALAPDVTGAIIREAHAQGMMVTGHIPTSMELHAAIDSGMDQVAHFPVRGDLTTEDGKKQIAHFVEKHIAFDPTASWGEIGGKSAQEPLQNIQPVLQHLPAPLLQNRIAGLGNGQSDTATAHARLARTLANINAAHAAGVPIITGTDEGVPAYSVYREIELFAKAGFTNMEALQAATSISARLMRVEKDLGTVERGKRADLLVLDANPLENISNIRSVRYVMKDGRMFESAALWTAAGFKP